MGLVNRRNAVLGWVVWTVGKRAAKRKARNAVSTDTARSKKGVAAGLAALGGALLFWRRRRSGDQPA
ncbi:MAG TPA: LPXTG cell wall anchor domain-containing protein [Gaiellaceae bacterium]|jgi:LPXTG-motif cell wall-anchored protein|nr:LPXTG cell wall anchor domain-containing protein [Gaiellaceae bacterium]